MAAKPQNHYRRENLKSHKDFVAVFRGQVQTSRHNQLLGKFGSFLYPFCLVGFIQRM
jgi:hypothetical protein